MNFLIRILVTAVVAFGLSSVLPGVRIDSFGAAILLSVVLAILNALLKPVLIILTFPITIITLGLFLFVINAGIILLAAGFVQGVRVDGFWPALLFSLLLSILVSILYKDPDRDRGRGRTD
ncbi:MAG: phage holin family protein [Puia sp.]|nr:phage holin family protein [Puia sp.]